MQKRVALVTGCAGYIGTILCQHLLYNDYQVLGVDSLAYNQESSLLHLVGNKDFQFHWQDCRDIYALKPLVDRADVVIPLAALVGAPACDKAPAYSEQVNFQAIADLVKEMSPWQRLVYPNTNSGYGQTDGTWEVTEDEPMNPISVYGRTKCLAEKVVLDHPRGVALRLATVFGPSPRMRFDLMVNDFVAKLMQGTELPIFEPHFKRNFVHVRDVARAFLWMANDPRLAGAFNVGLPTANLTKLELAHRICDMLSIPRERVWIADGVDPDQRNYIVSNAKLLKTLFKFEYELFDGVVDVANIARILTPPALQRMRNVA